jgi:hypothetical protein
MRTLRVNGDDGDHRRIIGDEVTHFVRLCASVVRVKGDECRTT